MTIQANQGFGVSIFGATSAGGGSTSPGGSSGQLQYNASGSFGGMAGTSWDDTNRALTLTGATVTTSNPVLNLSQTWNAGAVTFTGLTFNATDTASASGSLLLDLQKGGTSAFSVRKDGQLNLVGTASLYALTSIALKTGAGGTTVLSVDSANFVNISQNKLSFGGDAYLTKPTTATLQLGNVDAAAPVAQTLQVQSVVAGTSNTAGTNFTIKGSAGTGTGAGGSIIFQTATAGSSGTAQNAYATALTIGGTGVSTFEQDFFFKRTLKDGPSETMALSSPAAGLNPGITVGSGTVIGFASTTYWYGTRDVILARDAAGTLALRNGTNAQAFNIYNTYTDASNYERGVFKWSGNVLNIGSEAAGTGAQRGVVVGVNPTGTPSTWLALAGSYHRFYCGVTETWNISSAGNIIAAADNTYDIGASGTNRPRNVYVAGSGSTFPRLTISSDYIVLVSSATPKTNGGIGFAGGAYIGSGSISNIVLQANTAGAEKVTLSVCAGANDILGLGGSTSSFPALKRSSASLICRLADDSANAAFEALSLKTGAPAGGTSGTWKVGVYNATAPAATGYVEVDIGGTLYKLLAAT